MINKINTGAVQTGSWEDWLGTDVFGGSETVRMINSV